jgi:hypothetical protein
MVLPSLREKDIISWFHSMVLPSLRDKDITSWFHLMVLSSLRETFCFLRFRRRSCPRFRNRPKRSQVGLT